MKSHHGVYRCDSKWKTRSFGLDWMNVFVDACYELVLHLLPCLFGPVLVYSSMLACPCDLGRRLVQSHNGELGPGSATRQGKVGILLQRPSAGQDIRRDIDACRGALSPVPIQW